MTPPTIILGLAFSRSRLLGWGGLALFVLIGALTSGVSGALMNLGLFALVVALVALARGRVDWARLGSRAAAGVALGAALVLITIGSLASSTSTPPATDLTTTVSDSQTTTDEAAAAAKAADEAAATAAASKAADEAAAVAASQAADAAATQAANEAAAAAAAETKAADEAAAAAASKAADDAAAAAAAKAAADAAPAPAPPPDASVYYANCTAVRAAGAAPIYPGDPGFQSKFDRDKDGIGCE